MTITSSQQRVTVAGATGYLGRHIVSNLAQRGHHVTAIVRPGKSVPDAHRIVEADVLRPSSLAGVFDGADRVFSALGITRQSDAVTYEDVEYTANRHLLDHALASGVSSFGVISVVRPDVFEDLAILSSRERFIAELRQAPIVSTVVRATGFFSDMQQIFEMAASGRVYIVGEGTVHVNPVHGADLAEAAVDALLAEEATVNVGGPDVMTWSEIAQAAFQALGTPAKLTRIPAWISRVGLSLVRPFNRRAYDVGSFIVRGAQHELVAPCHGTHHLRSFFEDCARAHSS